MNLTIRHFFLGSDVALGRTWEFHDHLADRTDITYRLHIVGRYPGSPEDLDNRYYVIRETPLSWMRSSFESSSSEVWIIRGWNHPLIVLAAVRARYKRVPKLMWSERSGVTWEATTWKQTVRIWLRTRLLPFLFIPYRRDTVLLGAGQLAVKEFQKLSNGSPSRVFPYPNPVADACLGSVQHTEQSGDPLLLFAGNFTRRKAVDLIISACESLWRSGYRFRVRYVGSGPLESMIEEHVERSEGKAELFSFADRSTLVKHYGEADAVLLPSRHDGWGLTVHEGLASGVPVIVSNACGAADLVVDSGCGRVIQADSLKALETAISWILELTPRQRETIRAKAVSMAEQLTIPKLADMLLRYCGEVLERRASGGANH